MKHVCMMSRWVQKSVTVILLLYSAAYMALVLLHMMFKATHILIILLIICLHCLKSKLRLMNKTCSITFFIVDY
jgi:hypothetical protein